jgi:hypothetical protein
VNRFLRGSTVFIGAAFLAAAQASAYQEIEVSNGGTISGKVLAGSATAEIQTFAVTKDTAVCGTGTREVEWVRVNGGALLDVVVYVENVEAGKPFPEEAKHVALEQKECRFHPYLQVMANGGEVRTFNHDDAIHNVHAYELFPMDDGRVARRTVLNVTQFNFDPAFTKTIKLRRGKIVKLECEAHEFMHGWVFVARNPYYAVVDDDGEFAITDVPPGTYVVRSWHGRLGEKEMTVEVEAGGNVKASFSY